MGELFNMAKRIFSVLLIAILCLSFIPNYNKASAATLPGDVAPLWALDVTRTSATLYWATATDVTSYVLKRDNTIIYSGDQNHFTDTGLVENHTYTYTVYAKNDYGTGNPDTYSLTTLKTPTTGLTVTDATSNSIKLHIDTSDYPYADELTIYQDGKSIYYSTTFPIVFDYTVDNLEPGMTYNFEVYGNDPYTHFNFNYKATGTTDNTETAAQIQQYDEESTFFDQTSVSEVENTEEVLNFDTVQEFEDTMDQMEIDTLAEQEAQLDEPEIIDDGTVTDGTATFTTTATTYSGLRTIKWMPNSWNPLKRQILPIWMWIDFKFSYSGSGSTKKFVSITSVKSNSSGFPTTWHQTLQSSNLYDSNRGVNISIKGYHQLGFTIGGQTIGGRIHDSYTKKYHW